MSFLGKAVGNVMSSFCFLTEQNPFDAFKGEGAGTFDGFFDALTPILKDTYVGAIILGICLMVIAGIAAITILSLSKNDKKIAENKSWLMRIIFGVGAIGLFLSGVSIVWKISQKVNSSLDDDAVTPTPTPTAQIKEIPYREMDDLF